MNLKYIRTMVNILFNLKLPLHFLFFYMLNLSLVYSQHGSKFYVRETASYTIPYKSGTCVLKMPYAQWKILNPQDWRERTDVYEIKSVDMVFTKYPKRKGDWLTNYDSLLTRRIRQLKKLIPELENNSSIKWNIILQTDCYSNKEAKKMFHGAVINYKVILDKKLKQSFDNIRKIVSGRIGFPDSTVFYTFQRNIHWDSMLVVSDWTGSMYVYGAQVVLWYKLNHQRKNIRHFIFFNDGDKRPNSHKKLGETGGIYVSKSNSLRGVMHTMRNVMFHGDGGDKEENDIEALLFAIKGYPDFKDLILIADGRSAVRDIAIATDIKVPVRIILCGISKQEKIHPDYLNLAYLTKGSIHTMKEDIINMDSLSKREIITISNAKYRFIEKKFILLREDEY